MKKIVVLCFFVVHCFFAVAQPSEGTYVMQVTYSVKAGSGASYDASCTNLCRFHGWHIKGGNWEMFEHNLDNVQRSYYTNFPKYLEFPTSDRIEKMYTRGERYWKNLFNCNGEQLDGDIFYIDYTKRCSPQILTNAIPKWDGDVYIQVQPKAMEIHALFNGVWSENLYLSNLNTISLRATTGFNASYYKWYWRYTTGPDQQWKELSTGSSIVNIKSATFPDFTSNIGKNIEIKIDYGCGTTSRIISSRMQAAAIDIVPESPTCPGGSNGRLKITLARPLDPVEKLSLAIRPKNGINQTANYEYTYNHLNDATVFYIEKLSAGEYEYAYISKFNDVPSYIGTNNTDSLRGKCTIASKPYISFGAFWNKDVSCNGGSDGQISITGLLSGNSTAYFWRTNEGQKSQTVTSSNNVINGLQAGSYNIQIKNSDGCYFVENGGSSTAYLIKTASINQPSALTITKQDSLNPTGWGVESGNINIKVEGGTGTYSYILYKNNVQQPIQWKGTTVINNLGAGEYKIVVKDANQCQASLTVNLNQPPPLEINILNPAPVSCNGGTDGSVSFTANGGKGTLRYVLCKSNKDSIQPLYETSYSKLKAGNYIIKVVDQYGNTTFSNAFAITQPNVLKIDNITPVLPLCHGNSNGSLTANVSGGNGGYIYFWNGQSVSQVSPTLTSLSAGSYAVRVEDAKGCGTDIVFVDLDQPDSLKITDVLITPPDAYDAPSGKIEIVVKGGTGYHKYKLETQEIQYNLLNDSTKHTFTNLYARDAYYQATITDANNCSINGQYRVIYPLTPIIIIKDSIRCNGEANGALQANAVGGIGTAYKFSWYKVVNGDTVNLKIDSSVLSNRSAGIYRVKVTDEENNEMLSESFVFVAPNTVSIIFEAKHLLCKHDKDGELRANVTGGTPPYFYTWSNAKTFKAIDNLEEGIYYLEVTDSRGCLQISDTSIQAPTLLIPTISHIPPKAYNYSDAKAWVTTTGGVAPYQYKWDVDNSTNDTLSGLKHGIYSVVVIDANNCRMQTSDTIENPPLLQITSMQANNANCYDAQDGWIRIQAEGGVGNHYYTLSAYEENAWTDIRTISRSSTAQNMQPTTFYIFVGLPPEIYRVRVMDENNIFVYSDSIQISQPDSLILKASTTEVLCVGDSTGQIEVLVKGGTLPYLYEWSNGEINDLNEHLPTGFYTLKVTDQHQCTLDTSFTLVEPELFTINIGKDRVMCSEQILDLDASILDERARYWWFKDEILIDTMAKISISDSGVYVAKIENIDHCKAQDTLIIYGSSQRIIADFVVSSRILKDTIVKIINADSDFHENISWILPESFDFHVFDTTEEYLSMIFYETGFYTIGLRSTFGQCEQYTYKTIEVVDKLNYVDYAPVDDPFIKHFIIYPNPNNGDFTVKVELRESADITLLLRDLFGNTIDTRQLKDNLVFEESYAISAKSGLHSLQLISKKDCSVFKVMINE